ncbi:MAG: hypothetical protein IJL32_09155 [Oscillospiraceae bacterium]|nr:hypothetical protein [Oscillospiraceae bacterium]MBQ9905232.1 hypothetical protein [Oscillospiraceae bacterium]
MLKIEATSGQTALSCLGTPNELAEELAHVVQHVCKKIISAAAPEDQQEVSAVLATGMTLAVRNAFREVQGND